LIISKLLDTNGHAYHLTEPQYELSPVSATAELYIK
jgi:hypothetical protein